MIDVGARRDDGLQREYGQWVSIAQVGGIMYAGGYLPSAEDGT